VWESLFTPFSNISCDWSSTIFQWWSPSQVHMALIPVSSFRSTRSIRFIWNEERYTMLKQEDNVYYKQRTSGIWRSLVLCEEA
jgi:hypothetical protein